MYFHAIATLSGGRTKSVVNKTEEEMFEKYVLPFESTGIIREKWGTTRSYQALELRIYGTKERWNKKTDGPLEQFLGNARNRYNTFAKRARKAVTTPAHRVFVVMPIQGKEYGTMEEQRIFEEYDRRFERVENCLADFDCVGIRIDREHPLHRG